MISRRTLLALPLAAACTRPQEGFRGYAFIANQEGGAAVYEILRQRGRGLRVQLLSAEQTQANEISERMTSLPIAALAITFCGIILTPLLLGLLSSS